MMSVIITCAVEGPTDTPVAHRLVRHLGFTPGPAYEMGGKSRLDQRLGAYNNAAAFAPWLVLRDMDHGEPCAGALVQRLLPHQESGMCFRIAVREIEAWLLADRDALARYVSVNSSLVPLSPDTLPHPKRTLVDLARRSARRAIREDFVPSADSTAVVGPGYLSRISDFTSRYWRPDIAAAASPSLARCIRALKRLK
jgi:hypothetical protein